MSTAVATADAPVRERPILFSPPMVRALLAGTKTQTRRVVKPQPREGEHIDTCPWVASGWSLWGPLGSSSACRCSEVRCPYGDIGDRLWVRETWAIPPWSDLATDVAFRADLGPDDEREARAVQRIVRRIENPWRSPIHLPRRFARILLELTSIRVERVQDISEEDAKAEGVTPVTLTTESLTWPGGAAAGGGGCSARESFAGLWDSLHGPGAWERNDWVWVLSFRRIEP